MVQIVKVNYFPELNGISYNGKVLYKTSSGRLYHAHINICHFWRTIDVVKGQPKEAKVVPTLQRTLNSYSETYFSI